VAEQIEADIARCLRPWVVTQRYWHSRVRVLIAE